MSTHDARAKALTYGELMMLCEGHRTSKIYERHLEALLAVERETWEQAAQEFTSHWVAIMQQDARYDFVSACRAQGQGVGDDKHGQQCADMEGT